MYNDVVIRKGLVARTRKTYNLAKDYVNLTNKEFNNDE
jgi:hypothetical protein